MNGCRVCHGLHNQRSRRARGERLAARVLPLAVRQPAIQVLGPDELDAKEEVRAGVVDLVELHDHMGRKFDGLPGQQSRQDRLLVEVLADVDVEAGHLELTLRAAT